MDGGECFYFKDNLEVAQTKVANISTILVMVRSIKKGEKFRHLPTSPCCPMYFAKKNNQGDHLLNFDFEDQANAFVTFL